jgi:hypothetical protein
MNSGVCLGGVQNLVPHGSHNPSPAGMGKMVEHTPSEQSQGESVNG